MRRRYRKLRRRKHKSLMRNTIIIMVVLTLGFATGYSAFQTVISINAKGNIKQTDFYVSSNGSDVEGKGTLEKPYATIQKAYDVAPEKAKIFIMDNINVLSIITFSGNKNILLTSYSENNTANSIVRDSTFKKQIIDNVIGDLVLNNIVIDGNNIESEQPMIFNQKGILKIQKDTVLQNNISSANGGAIWNAENGKLIIEDGIIKNNKSTYFGGGINNNGIIEMNGGTITENQASRGGAIYSNSNVTINGGLINKNIVVNYGGGLFINSNSLATMNGGIIEKNVNQNINGGGVSVDGTFTMNGDSKIINNKAENGSGGGVQIGTTGTFTMNNGTISGNTALGKHGVWTYGNGQYIYVAGNVQND